MWQAFRECGSGAWLGLLLGVFGNLLGLAALGLSLAKVKAARVVAIVSLALAVSIPVLGVVARFWALSRTERAIANIDPEMQARIMTEGVREANMCIPVTLVEGSLPLLLSATALLILLLQAKQAPYTG